MELLDLRHAARDIFESALRAVDAREAVLRSLRLDGCLLRVVDETLDLSEITGVYVVAMGKAAAAMTAGLNKVLGPKIERGILTCPGSRLPSESEEGLERNRWRVFRGGHPLPNIGSISAAHASMGLLKKANQPGSLVVFLVSGGGSAMMEWPAYDWITLEELTEANRQLVSSGATIAEINAVRRTFSAVKGGKLAALAPQADQITLIISDTNAGDEADVASGPTLTPYESPDPNDVIERYGLRSSLPESILRSVAEDEHRAKVASPGQGSHRHFVLLSNQDVIQTAAATAARYGFNVEIAEDIREQEVAQGCELMLSRLKAISDRSPVQPPICLLSGGEFSCPVKGNGLGGRNSETVLRFVTQIDKNKANDARHTVVLSAGTDGIDGNSTAAGAIGDEVTIERARSLGLNAESFLERSDSFRFFSILGDAITTGPTGTNVRDLRIALESP